MYRKKSRRVARKRSRRVSRRVVRNRKVAKSSSGKTIVYLKKSNKPDKKFMVYVDGKTVHFGARGMSDYTIHKDRERMKRYVNRHRGKENWSKSGIKTAGFWSKHLLWGKPSFSASKRDIATKFNVTFRSGWPKK